MLAHHFVLQAPAAADTPRSMVALQLLGPFSVRCAHATSCWFALALCSPTELPSISLSGSSAVHASITTKSRKGTSVCWFASPAARWEHQVHISFISWKCQDNNSRMCRAGRASQPPSVGGWSAWAARRRAGRPRAGSSATRRARTPARGRRRAPEQAAWRCRRTRAPWRPWRRPGPRRCTFSSIKVHAGGGHRLLS